MHIVLRNFTYYRYILKNDYVEENVRGCFTVEKQEFECYNIRKIAKILAKTTHRMQEEETMRYTYLDLIEEVLRKEKREMTLIEIWEVALKLGYSDKLESVGKTPVNTMNACVRKHISTSKKVRFKQTSKKPALYYLND